MLAVIILVLVGGIFVSVASCFAMFMEVAFSPTVLPDRNDAGFVGLPILTGGNLHDWGKQLALDIASNEANRKRNGNAAVAMAVEVESAISKIVARMSAACPQVDSKVCSSCRCDVIPLTAPEALAIADDLRQRCSARTIENIRARARRNLQSNVRAPRQVSPSASNGICPLYSVDDGSCLAHAARPVYCRGRIVVSNVSSPIASPAADKTEDSFATTLGEGMLVGLASALGEAHYGQHIYELNGALAAALEDPDASRHWEEGEAVFASYGTIDGLVS
jgi:hypothetical protein